MKGFIVPQMPNAIPIMNITDTVFHFMEFALIALLHHSVILGKYASTTIVEMLVHMIIFVILIGITQSAILVQGCVKLVLQIQNAGNMPMVFALIHIAQCVLITQIVLV